MANTNTQKPKTVSSLSRPKSIRRFGKTRRLLIVLVCLLVTVVGSVVIYDFLNKRAIEEDKRRFAQADADVTKVVADIVAAIGPPYKQEMSRRCTLPGVKYEAKRIHCSVESKLFYQAASSDQATSLLQNFDQLVGQNWIRKNAPRLFNTDSSRNFSSIDVADRANAESYQQIVRDYQYPKAKMECGVVYYYYAGDSPPSNSFLLSPGNSIFYASIDCGDDAKLAHFPVDE